MIKNKDNIVTSEVFNEDCMEVMKHYPEQIKIFNHIISHCIFTEGVSRAKSVQYLKTTMQHLQAELNRLEAITTVENGI